ncbi:hypothetical protein DWQ65_10455 [Treponema phagedenis]|uniref:Lipoprotein n=1 Tax=Treponema phagedenis TaxID=162 RepID=A0A0B7GXT8_TREPH|nr:hypothetical protein [Treponema phagedenis]NVP23992.1 hypothetical protein [Treponema phagedenis]QEJ96172.1 hypothetical protein FUT79_13840 [Treponema phagedenis]QEJ99438.1 hypothetical protein FUT82_16545 [Treponema phagedenis]QEJ99873.1 hypothetical protein FUT84_00900 [Treponema phagedenis]QEK05009.1 hypothetical protein FUT83_15195 [Treponema phagedenis]
MNLKKLISAVIITGLVFVGCKFSNDVGASKENAQDATQWANLTTDRPEVARQLDTVGVEHNKMLDEMYAALVSFKASGARSASSESGLSDDEISFVLNQYLCKNVSRSVSEDVSVPIELSSGEALEAAFSPVVQKSVEQIKALTEALTEASSKSEVVAVLQGIETIEKEAEKDLSAEEKEPFYAYTATARASLAYWYDNLSKWDALRGNNAQRSAKGVEMLKKISFCIASDAGGAYEGWVKTSELIEKYIPFANNKLKLALQIIGSTATAGCSSAEGWKQGKYVIAFPHELVLQKINKKIQQKN